MSAARSGFHPSAPTENHSNLLIVLELRQQGNKALIRRSRSTMTNVDFARYKRIVQYFWDPEPKNDDISKAPIWCLGLQYTAVADRAPPSTSDSVHASETHSNTTASTSAVNGGRLNNTSSSSSDKDVAKGDFTRDTLSLGAWPSSFLDDFESKIWLTYRSNFPPIARSLRSEASTTSFSERLKSQLVDQAGFTTDTGWGCMIRSGQSLLANALILLKLGRGMPQLD